MLNAHLLEDSSSVVPASDIPLDDLDDIGVSGLSKIEVEAMLISVVASWLGGSRLNVCRGRSLC